MATCKIGEFAKSKAGHDKDQIFIILMIEDEYVYLVDGKSRKLDSQRKKDETHSGDSYSGRRFTTEAGTGCRRL